MAFNIASLSRGVCIKAPRIVLLGVEKIGKSTFAAGSDSPVFVSMKGEEGIDSIDVNKFPVVRSFDDLLECFKNLYLESHDNHTVVIDSASTLEPVIWDDVCRREGGVAGIEKVGGGYGKGYTEALARWRQITDSLDALREARGMGSIIVGHVRVKRKDDPCGPSYDTYQFDINEKAANLLYRWADAIWFANTKVVVKTEEVGFNKEKHRGIDITGGARYLYTQKSPAFPSGGRGIWGQIPHELPLNWGSVLDAVQAAMQRNEK